MSPRFPLPLHDRAAPVVGPYDVQTREAFLDLCRRSTGFVPPTSQQVLRQVGRGQAWCLIKGLPIDPQLGPTPTTFVPDKITFLSEFVLATCGSLLGEVFGTVDEKAGHLLHQVAGRAGYENERSSLGSKAPLEEHTERAALVRPPDALLLLCLRGGACLTYLSDVRAALRLCRAHTRRLLTQPLWQFCPGASSSGGRTPVWSEPWPVIELTSQGTLTRTRVDFNDMRSLNPAAAQALAEFRQALRDVRAEVCLQPGDLVAINNRTCVHSRGPYELSGAQTRWLQRVYVDFDLPSRGQPQVGTRVF